jgi:hypothetical protein
MKRIESPQDREALPLSVSRMAANNYKTVENTVGTVCSRPRWKNVFPTSVIPATTCPTTRTASIPHNTIEVALRPIVTPRPAAGIAVPLLSSPRLHSGRDGYADASWLGVHEKHTTSCCGGVNRRGPRRPQNRSCPRSSLTTTRVRRHREVPPDACGAIPWPQLLPNAAAGRSQLTFPGSRDRSSPCRSTTAHPDP